MDELRTTLTDLLKVVRKLKLNPNGIMYRDLLHLTCERIRRRYLILATTKRNLTIREGFHRFAGDDALILDYCTTYRGRSVRTPLYEVITHHLYSGRVQDPVDEIMNDLLNHYIVIERNDSLDDYLENLNVIVRLGSSGGRKRNRLPLVKIRYVMGDLLIGNPYREDDPLANLILDALKRIDERIESVYLTLTNYHLVRIGVRYALPLDRKTLGLIRDRNVKGLYTLETRLRREFKSGSDWNTMPFPVRKEGIWQFFYWINPSLFKEVFAVSESEDIHPYQILEYRGKPFSIYENGSMGTGVMWMDAVLHADFFGLYDFVFTTLMG